jgi:NodT family efflux transporter outer membrane factor (OMF) lipoprotein
MKRVKRSSPSILLCGLLLALGGCAMGPDYTRPALESPASFRVPEGWKLAETAGTPIPSNWWEVFGDSQLNALEQKLLKNNATLAQQEAAMRQAQAAVDSASAGLFPTLNAAASTSRVKASGGAVGLGQGLIYNNYATSLQASWLPDLWGTVRRGIEANVATLQASESQLAASTLAVQSQLALDYFLLRTDDAQAQLLDQTIKAYENNLKLNQDRFSQGVAAETDVLQAQSQLHAARAQRIDLGIARTQLQDAIAVLVGQPSSTFVLAEVALQGKPPVVPLEVPSRLLERRPDIAVAERNAAAASAQIGVATAAFFPNITLSGNMGYQSKSYSNLVSQPNTAWTLSPQILLPLFDGGLRSASLSASRAAFDGAVANYRAVVLAAFQNVEDNLVAADRLGHEDAAQQQVVDAARRTLELTQIQYEQGTVAYLNVISAQTTLLSSQVTELTLRNRQFAAAVQLVAAMGGGWQGQAPLR